MKITLLWVGKTRNAHIKSLIDDYWKRLEHFCELSLREVHATRSDIANRRLAVLESEKLLARVDVSDYVVLLEATGKSFTTETFATWLCRHRDQSTRNLVFVIGGHEGLSESLKHRANLCISLSPLTFTHEMARCLLLEQIYRAFSLIHGFPYHK